MANETDIKKGVESAWDFWLSQHEVSVPDIIEIAIKDAFGSWLRAHTDDILERLRADALASDLGEEDGSPDASPPLEGQRHRGQSLSLRSVEDIVAEGERTDQDLARRLAEGTAAWGNWRYVPDADTGQLVLEEKGQAVYEVDLARCDSAAEIFDWIFHLEGKSFITLEDLGQFVRALRDILTPGGWGNDATARHDVKRIVAERKNKR